LKEARLFGTSRIESLARALNVDQLIVSQQVKTKQLKKKLNTPEIFGSCLHQNSHAETILTPTHSSHAEAMAVLS
jgi:hypothetical protein